MNVGLHFGWITFSWVLGGVVETGETHGNSGWWHGGSPNRGIPYGGLQGDEVWSVMK